MLGESIYNHFPQYNRQNKYVLCIDFCLKINILRAHIAYTQVYAIHNQQMGTVKSTLLRDQFGKVQGRQRSYPLTFTTPLHDHCRFFFSGRPRRNNRLSNRGQHGRRTSYYEIALQTGFVIASNGLLLFFFFVTCCGSFQCYLSFCGPRPSITSAKGIKKIGKDRKKLVRGSERIHI